VHILKLDKEIIVTKEYTLRPDVEYLAEDVNGAQLLFHAGGGKMTPLMERRPFDETQDWNGKRILIIRVGGLGDLTLLTPVLREIKRRWPRVVLNVCCHKEFGQSLHHLPYINDLPSFPMTLEDAKGYDAWVFYENAIERNEDAKTIHSVDVYAKIIGLSEHPEFDKKSDYRVTMRENIWAEESFPRINGTRRICVQTNASARCRTYPLPLLGQVLAQLLKNKWQIFLMGKPGELQMQPQPGITMLSDGYTFRQRCAVIAGADVVLAPDSSLTHIAGALGIPCVALYGPFPWSVRTKYTPTTFGINGAGDCAPCFHHAHLHDEFPKNCPSKQRGVCQVLEGIKPERIVAKIETVAKGFKFSVIEGGADKSDEPQPASPTP
jgi:ADP-heptose:LPS heptosyltransferase